MPNYIGNARPAVISSTAIQAGISRRNGGRHSVAAFIVPAITGALFVMSAAHAAPTKKVPLGAAGAYVMLSETGITDVYQSAITGNVGVSPITGAADHLSCDEVTGHIYSVDAAGPAPCNRANPAKLGLAVGAMNKAYTNAASRHPGVTELGAGNIGGLTLLPGVYAWSSSVLIPNNVTLKGGTKDVWIFQVAQNVNLASATSIMLAGGALPQNIFWQVAGSVTMGTTSVFEGNVMSMTSIAMQTGATIHGRLYAQSAISLEMNSVQQPTPPDIISSVSAKSLAGLTP